MASQIEFLIEQKRSASRNRNIKLRTGRPPLYPKGIENKFSLYLRKYVSKLISITREKIYPILPLVVQEIRLSSPLNIDYTKDIVDYTDFIVKKDDFVDEVDDALKSTRFSFQESFPEDSIERELNEIALLTFEGSRKEVTKSLKSILGVDIFVNEPPLLNTKLKAFVKSNVDFIETIEARHISRVENTIYEGLQRGLRHEEIQKKLVKDFKVSENNAKRIARDQLGKLNGQINKAIQKNLGIKEYIWITSLDERVRGNPLGLYPNAVPSHAARHGKTFKWSKAPSDGHPGQPIQCRCIAKPKLDEFINE